MVNLSKESLTIYYKGFQKRLYKTLPILEGKDISGRVVFLPEIAKENFQKHVGKLLVEVYGNSSLFFTLETGGQLVGLLRGMLLDIDIENAPAVRSLVFDCMTLIEKNMKHIQREREGDESGI